MLESQVVTLQAAQREADSTKMEVILRTERDMEALMLTLASLLSY